MKSLFTTLVFSVVFVNVSIGQSNLVNGKNFQAGINVEIAYPLQNKTIHTVDQFEYDETIKTGYSIGFGASLMGRYAMNEKAFLTGSIGYMNFLGKNGSIRRRNEDDSYTTEDYKTPDFHGIPLRVGANYLLGKSFFVQGEIGASFMKGGTAFLFAPGIGARFNQFEVEAKYEGWSKSGIFSFTGLRLGYFF